MATPRKPPEEHKPSGRPTKYKEEYCQIAHNFVLLGMTNEELAKGLGIDIATLYNWQNTHPKFLEAIKDAKEGADGRVIAALYKRACGYDVSEEKITPRGDIVECKTHIPPETRAAQFILKNRHADKWKDKHEIHNTGEFKMNFDQRQKGLLEEEKPEPETAPPLSPMED